jgi:hypothetical protein
MKTRFQLKRIHDPAEKETNLQYKAIKIVIEKPPTILLKRN